MPISPEHGNIKNSIAGIATLTALVGATAAYQEYDSSTVASVDLMAEVQAEERARNNKMLVRQAGVLASERVFPDRSSRSADTTAPTIDMTTTSTVPATTTTASTTTSLAPTTTIPPPPPPATVDGEWRQVPLGEFVSTCYALTPKGTRGGPGSIAVDPRVIPMGTELEVEGYGRGQARDTGGDIKGRRIDVWLPTISQCMQWGRRAVEVTMLERAG